MVNQSDNVSDVSEDEEDVGDMSQYFTNDELLLGIVFHKTLQSKLETFNNGQGHITTEQYTVIVNDVGNYVTRVRLEMTRRGIFNTGQLTEHDVDEVANEVRLEMMRQGTFTTAQTTIMSR